MSNEIHELFVVDDASTIFTRGGHYLIPRYQRPYAWKEPQIERLIEDIGDISADGEHTYYLGSLVVAAKEDNTFEVIDGQQRLTTLYLLLHALGYVLPSEEEHALSFACRGRSDYTLTHLPTADGSASLDEALAEPSILAGLDIIRHMLATNFTEEELSDFRRKLARTCLYRITVPKHTDLNRYFEIMNTRGEQLEQHEILKAQLMDPLDTEDADAFAEIWDACSDMACYVQMRFDPHMRATLFGRDYDQLPTERSMKQLGKGKSNLEETQAIKDIIKQDPDTVADSTNEDGDPIRFKSIIDFPFFLLHTLKVFMEEKGLLSGNETSESIPLDDKKLTATFQAMREKAAQQGVNETRFANEFARTLLQARFLFDTCIIKREYLGPIQDDEDDGTWSLKQLMKGSRSSVYYRNTRFLRCQRQHRRTYEPTNRSILMLQGCLRVSYTSPRAMHWITQLLGALVEDPTLASSDRFEARTEECIQQAVHDALLDLDPLHGSSIPHIVYNYLDYLLWKKAKQQGAEPMFEFEFRNSLEHWYPQHPTEDTFPPWDEVDRFGNLCLLQRRTNSRFSNLSPKTKQDNYEMTIAKGSLKLREMARLTKAANEWKGGVCKAHEDEMLELLKEATTSRFVINGA